MSVLETRPGITTDQRMKVFTISATRVLRALYESGRIRDAAEGVRMADVRATITYGSRLVEDIGA